MKGMTGFGRLKVCNEQVEVSVEISSVNKRHLDINVRLPRGYQQAESSIRRFLSTRVFRGQVTVSISIQPLQASAVALPIKWPQIDGRLNMLQQIAEHVGAPLPKDQAIVELWRWQMEVVETKEEGSPEIEALILRAVTEAFEVFDIPRRAEGAHLREDLAKRLAMLKELKSQIVEKLVDHVDHIRQRLSTLVQKCVPGLPFDDRLLREVVLYADKADVSEELSRIDHHARHVEQAMDHEEPSGKVLEFVLQELLREFNTLGSKTSQAEVATAVVLAKTELEKMREQVQNVE